MNLIVNTRCNERRLTIFTSNYKGHSRRQRSERALLFRIGYRMRSRLHGCATSRSSTVPITASCRNGGPEDLLMMWKMRGSHCHRPDAAAVRPERN